MTIHLERAQRQAIVNSPLCAGLAEADIDLLLQGARLLEVGRDRVVVAEGQPPLGLHLMLEGLVEVQLRRVHEGVVATLPLGQIGAGGVFGEYGAWDPRPASANVVTLTPARIALIPLREFQNFIDHHDKPGKILLGNLLRVLIQRLRLKVAEADALVLTGAG